VRRWNSLGTNKVVIFGKFARITMKMKNELLSMPLTFRRVMGRFCVRVC